MSNTFFQKNKPKFLKYNAFGTLFTAVLAIILVVALIFCAVSLRNANHFQEVTAQQLKNQQSAFEQLQQDTLSAQEELEKQEQEISDLQSQLQEKDKDIASFEKQVSDLTSRYNKLVKKQRKEASESSKKDTAPNKNNKTDKNQTATVSKPTLQGTTAVTQKTCYLTFDDGPSENTLEILKILKKYNVKATFFVINTDHIQYVKQIHQQGHAVALHSYSHDYSQIYRSQKAYFSDLEAINKAVKQYTGEDTKVIRFPGGTSNTVSRQYCNGIMTALSKEVTNRGYVYFDWNVDSTDAAGNNVPVSTIMQNIRDYGGFRKQEVVLMHDTDAKDTTVKALPQIIEFYIEKGYTFAPITVTTPPVTHPIFN